VPLHLRCAAVHTKLWKGRTHSTLQVRGGCCSCAPCLVPRFKRSMFLSKMKKREVVVKLVFPWDRTSNRHTFLHLETLLHAQASRRWRENTTMCPPRTLLEGRGTQSASHVDIMGNYALIEDVLRLRLRARGAKTSGAKTSGAIGSTRKSRNGQNACKCPYSKRMCWYACELWFLLEPLIGRNP